MKVSQSVSQPIWRDLQRFLWTKSSWNNSSAFKSEEIMSIRSTRVLTLSFSLHFICGICLYFCTIETVTTSSVIIAVACKHLAILRGRPETSAINTWNLVQRQRLHGKCVQSFVSIMIFIHHHRWDYQRIWWGGRGGDLDVFICRRGKRVLGSQLDLCGS